MLAALVAWFIGQTIVHAWDGLRHHDWTVSPLWLLASGALYLIGLLPSALFWHATMRAIGQTPGLFASLRAYYIGHLGKYVPGKALVVILRAGLVRSPGVGATAAAVAVFCETLTTMAVGAFLAAMLLAICFREQQFFVWLSLGLMVLAVVPTVPQVFRRLAQWAGVNRRNPQAAEQLRRLGYTWLLGGWMAISLGWLITGLSLWSTLRGLGIAASDNQPPLPFADLPLWTAAVSLATVAGFLSFIPGGAGVREAVLIALMQQSGFTAADALLAAAMLRVVWLAAELLAAGAFSAVGRRGVAP